MNFAFFVGSRKDLNSADGTESADGGLDSPKGKELEKRNRTR